MRKLVLCIHKWFILAPTTHHAILQACEEVSIVQTVPDASLRAVVSLGLDHVSLEQPLTEAVLVTPLILPVLK